MKIGQVKVKKFEQGKKYLFEIYGTTIIFTIHFHWSITSVIP